MKLVIKKDANAIVNKLVNLPDVKSEKNALVRATRDGDKYQFSSKLQIMITKIAVIAAQVIDSPRPKNPSTNGGFYFVDALRYLCWEIVSCKELWGIFEDAKINKTGNEQKHLIAVDVTKIDIARCRKQYNKLVELVSQATHANSFGSLKIPKLNQPSPPPNRAPQQPKPNVPQVNPSAKIEDVVGTVTLTLRPGQGVIKIWGKEKLHCFFDLEFVPAKPDYKISKIQASIDKSPLKLGQGANELKISTSEIKRPLAITVEITVNLGKFRHNKTLERRTVSMNY